MRVSARLDYSCRALTELALHYPKTYPVRIQDIAREQDMPLKYTIQILNQLKRLGLVKSIRGREGGYVIAKSPDKISLGEIIREISGALLPIAESAAKNDSVFSKIWKEVENGMAEVLDEISFEDIANKIRGIKGTINYNI